MAVLEATGVAPGTIKLINGFPRVALVGFDKNGDTCLKWYIPKTSRDINAARKYVQGDGK